MSYNVPVLNLRFIKNWSRSFFCVIILLLLKNASADASIPVFTKSVSINFGPATAPVPTGYVADVGLPYDSLRGYGWINTVSKLPENHTANMRYRSGTGDLRLLTLVQMQGTNLGQTPGNWEYALPNGKYKVTVSAGDGTFDSDNEINIEGLPAISDFTSNAALIYKTATVVVQVTDGKLTVDAKGGTNTRMNYIIISPVTPVADLIPPTAKLRVYGVTSFPKVYKTSAKVYITASDSLSGLASLQYSINNSAFKTYTSPITLTIAAAYSIVVKAIDANGNQTITQPYNFTVTIKGPNGQYMALKNMDNFPSNDRLVFSRIQIPWRRVTPDTTPYNRNHDKVVLRISNKGTGTLNLSSLQLSNPTAWKIDAINTDTTNTLPISLTSGSYADVTVHFIANNAAIRVKTLTDTLVINSNDTISPIKKVILAGIWQAAGESTNEPYVEQIWQAFGINSKAGYGHDDGNVNGTTRVPNSDEVVASYFTVADPSKPVTVYQAAAYHSCCSAVEDFRYFYQGTKTYTSIITSNTLDGQSVLPRKVGSSTILAQNSFIPKGTFGFKIGSSFSDRTLNFGGLIGIRFLKVVDAHGNVVPNAYLMDCDYLGQPFTNYDYQDNLYYVDNIKPYAGSLHYPTLVSTPSAVNFPPALAGTTTTIPITLSNPGTTYPDSSSDPNVTISNIKIAGPNAAEFALVSLKPNTVVAKQSSIVLSVKFTPKSLGIKNAVLLINYGSSVPLRVPLYGVSNTTTSTISLVKRIKSGSDTAMKINGNLYESDKLYRLGSVQLDNQKIAGPIAATDDDKLYQSYLSANAELAETDYEIPVPNGNYMVRMHFAENFWTAPNSRIFSVTMENSQLLSDYDIFNEVGYRTAQVKDFMVTVADSSLSVKLNPTVNRASLSGIEIYKANPVLVTAKALALTNQNSLAGSAGRKLTLFPNPNSGSEINMKAENFAKSEMITVEISNITGKLLQTQTFVTDETGFGLVNIPLKRKLGMGIYIINSHTSSGIINSKLMVQ